MPRAKADTVGKKAAALKASKKKGDEESPMRKDKEETKTAKKGKTKVTAVASEEDNDFKEPTEPPKRSRVPSTKLAERASPQKKTKGKKGAAKTKKGTGEEVPAAKGTKTAEQIEHENELLRNAASVANMTDTHYWKHVNNIYKPSDIVMVDKNDLEPTDFIRGELDAAEDQFADNMTTEGWQSDSVLLIGKATPAVCELRKNKNMHFVYEGSSRTRAVKRVPSITHVPCRIITMPPGMTEIPHEHAICLGRQKNDTIARSRGESSIDFLVSVANVFSKDAAKSEEEILNSEFPERLVGPRGVINWTRVRAILHLDIELDNKLKVAHRIYAKLGDAGINKLKDLNARRDRTKEDPWSMNKLQAVHFLNCDTDIRDVAIAETYKGTISSENELNAFCARRMTERLVDQIATALKIQPALITVDVVNDLAKMYESKLGPLSREKQLPLLKEGLVKKLADNAKPPTALEIKKAKAAQRRAEHEARQEGEEVEGALTIGNQNLNYWAAALNAVGNSLLNLLPHVVLCWGELAGVLRYKELTFDTLLFQPQGDITAAATVKELAPIFAKYMKQTQTLHVILEDVSMLPDVLPVFQQSGLHKVTQHFFFPRKISRTDAEFASAKNKPNDRHCIVVTYRTVPSLSYFAPDEVTTLVGSSLEYGCAIPVPWEFKKACLPQEKVPFMDRQIPPAVYIALFELMVPEGAKVLDVCSNAGGGAIAAIHRGNFWVGMELRQRWKDNTPRYVLQQLSKHARDLEYFEAWAAATHGEKTNFLENYVPFSADEAAEVERKGVDGLLKLIPLDAAEYKSQYDAHLRKIFTIREPILPASAYDRKAGAYDDDDEDEEEGSPLVPAKTQKPKPVVADPLPTPEPNKDAKNTTRVTKDPKAAKGAKKKDQPSQDVPAASSDTDHEDSAEEEAQAADARKRKRRTADHSPQGNPQRPRKDDDEDDSASQMPPSGTPVRPNTTSSAKPAPRRSPRTPASDSQPGRQRPVFDVDDISYMDELYVPDSQQASQDAFRDFGNTQFYDDFETRRGVSPALLATIQSGLQQKQLFDAYSPSYSPTPSTPQSRNVRVSPPSSYVGLPPRTPISTPTLLRAFSTPP